MTVHKLKFNDEDVDISVSATRSTIQGFAGNAEVSKLLMKAGTSFFLNIDGVILSEKKQAISLEAQLMSWVGEIDTSDTNDWIVLLPFDEKVYVAFLDVAQNYVSVAEERIVDFDDIGDIRSEARNDENAYYEFMLIDGGKLTQDVLKLNLSPICIDSKTNKPILLEVKQNIRSRQFTLKKSTNLLTVFAPILIALIVFFLFYFWVTSEPEVPEEILKPEPKASQDIGYQLLGIADIVAQANKLIHHDIAQINIKGDSVAFVGSYVSGKTDYKRLVAIAAEMKGQISIAGSTWRMHSLINQYERQPLVPLKSLDDTTRMLVEIDAAHVVGVSIGTGRDLGPLGKERIDKISLGATGFNEHAIASLGKEFKEHEIYGRVVSASIVRPKTGLWNTLTIDIQLKGK
jgi:hypothetical protein